LVPSPLPSHSHGDHRDLHAFPTRRSSDLFDFRSQGDLMGWTGSGLTIQDNGLNIPVYTSASQSISDLNWGAGVRVQVLGKDLVRSEEHTSELQSRENIVCRLLLEKKDPSK